MPPTPTRPDEAGTASVEDRRTPLGTVLLLSYASAVTLALAWALVVGRPGSDRVRRSEPEPGGLARRDRQTRHVGEAAPLDPALIATPGRAIRVDDLEVVPLGVARADGMLRHLPGSEPVRRGGADALRLRLRLRNHSADTAFAPMDEGFVRDPDRGAPDSFLEHDAGRIYLYPLAAESEWAIVGQEFPTLNPGESAELSIFTAAGVDAPVGPATWRLRLRTGPGRSAVVGVRIDPAEARP